VQLCKSARISVPKDLSNTLRRMIASFLSIIFFTYSLAPTSAIAQTSGKTEPSKNGAPVDSKKEDIEKLLPNRAHGLLEDKPSAKPAMVGVPATVPGGKAAALVNAPIPKAKTAAAAMSAKSDTMPPVAPNVVRSSAGSSAPSTSLSPASSSASSSSSLVRSQTSPHPSSQSHPHSSPHSASHSNAHSSPNSSNNSATHSSTGLTTKSSAQAVSSTPEEPSVRISRPGRPATLNSADALRNGAESDTRISRPNFPATAPARNLYPANGSSPSSTGSGTASTARPGSSGASGIAGPSTPGKIGTATAGSGSTSTPSSASKPSPTDLYPQIGKLEQLTFGVSKAELPIEERILALENAIFATTYPNDSLFDRTERLKVTLLGKGQSDSVIPPATNLEPPAGYVENPLAGNAPSAAELQYFDEIIQDDQNYKKASKAVLDAFALEMINFERDRRALGKLDQNPLVQKLADEHVKDLVDRNLVSHNNVKGENPDRRYTMLGGQDAVNENLLVLPVTEIGTTHMCKAAVAKVLKQMFIQQDEREALLAPEASHLGFSMERMNDGARIIACSEIMTSRGEINSLPKTARLGDKVEVSGVVQAPYQFDRISVAWEGVSDLSPQEENSDEPLPYFPPLDFVAYKEKSEKDHTKAIFALKTVGMLAAIAGGMFVPPVALAAPLIMMAGNDPIDPKPVSDVPIKGGVKVDGNSFNGRVALSNEGKEGLYYVTVWGHITPEDKPVAISRRAIMVKQVHDEEDVEGSVSIPKAENKDKDRDKNNQDKTKLSVDKSESGNVSTSKPTDNIKSEAATAGALSATQDLTKTNLVEPKTEKSDSSIGDAKASPRSIDKSVETSSASSISEKVSSGPSSEKQVSSAGGLNNDSSKVDASLKSDDADKNVSDGHALDAGQDAQAKLDQTNSVKTSADADESTTLKSKRKSAENDNSLKSDDDDFIENSKHHSAPIE
jgi:hypothetical protein